MELAILSYNKVVRSVFPVGPLTDKEKEELHDMAERKGHTLRFQRKLGSSDLREILLDLEDKS